MAKTTIFDGHVTDRRRGDHPSDGDMVGFRTEEADKHARSDRRRCDVVGRQPFSRHCASNLTMCHHVYLISLDEKTHSIRYHYDKHHPRSLVAFKL